MRRLGYHFSFNGQKVGRASACRKIIAGILTVSFVLVFQFVSLIGLAYAASSDSDLIPEEAIRIRILANSDTAFDQQVKQAVRNRAEGVILSWGPMPETYDAAHALISSRLDEIRSAADQVLDELGAPYAADVELGKIPFPDKLFAGESYEAGDYEALRITLGSGKGSNWWCVLFPPLCITAATAKDAAGEAQAIEQTNSAERPADGQQSGESGSDSDSGERPKPRFFLWEMLKKLGQMLSALFA